MFISPSYMKLVLVLILRIVNAFALATFFQPDEYFQTFEPAHMRVFGYGFLTWEWKFGLRGSLIPIIYEYLFRLSQYLSIDYLVVCKLFQGTIAGVGDIYTFKLARKLESIEVAKYAILASLLSSFYFYCGTRPFSNTFEMVFTTVALFYWPLNRFQGYTRFLFSSILAHFAIALRPTNATLWLILGVRLLWNSRPRRILILTALSAIVAVVLHGAEYILDNWYYGFNVWPLWSFVSANIGDKVSHYYGVMPLHFYFTSALPMLLAGYLPVTIVGLLTKLRGNLLAQIVLSQLIIYSFLAHKEFRFIFYLLPLLHIIFARTLLRMRLKKWFALFALVNIIVSGYLSFFHQRGVISVTEYIRKEQSITEVSFLMPCHSTPGYAHFHRDTPLNISVLGCDPPIVVPKEERDIYVDEADQFYTDPIAFLSAHQDKLTETIVIFEALIPDIEPILAEYTEVARFFNGFFNEDSRRKGDVIVYGKTIKSS